MSKKHPIMMRKVIASFALCKNLAELKRTGEVIPDNNLNEMKIVI